MKNIRILLCDDHNLVRSGFASLLNDSEGTFVIAEAEDGNQMVSKYFETKPDLIISDIEMPGLTGLDAFEKIKEKEPDVKVLFLSVYYSEQYINHANKIGAMGLLSKTITKGELLFAVNEIIEGRKYFGSEYDDDKLSEIVTKYQKKKKNAVSEEIADIDDKILQMIAEGFTSETISAKLFKSVYTINAHRAKLIIKLNLKNGNELHKYAVLYAENKKL